MITEAELLFQLNSHQEFNEFASRIFQKQSSEETVYGRFLKLLNRPAARSWQEAPFLPISLFKSHSIKSHEFNEEAAFTSSGTTGQERSKHYVDNLDRYSRIFTENFRRFYGPPSNYRILALLPSYLERSGSSLVTMARGLIDESNHPENGFYLDDLEGLSKILSRPPEYAGKTLLLGVTFALLDLAERYPQNLDNTIIMETGGMKGRREEMTREDVHDNLKRAFGLSEIHSEYGMTELLSQAYSLGEGRFYCPPWMKVMARNPRDPFQRLGFGEVGGLDIIDLGNQQSCAFIATEDLGRVFEDGSFEVLGRFDEAEARGCNLLYTG